MEHNAFYGRHLLGELYGISAEVLDDEVAMTALLVAAVAEGGATLCGVQHKRFEPNGVTVIALLAESHASLHTYPDRGAVFLDVFTCGAVSPQGIADALVRALAPNRVETRVIERGD